MNKAKRVANLALALSLALLLALQPYSAAAQAPDGGHQHDETCGYAEASPCLHKHEEGCGYTEETPEVPCDMECEGGTHAEDCAYAPAAPEIPCAHQHDEGCGYAEAVPCAVLPEGAGVAGIGIAAAPDALNDPPLSISSEGEAYTGQTTAGTYTISTAAQLAELARVVDSGTFGLSAYSGSVFLLTADIDLSESDSYESLTWSGGNWEPIGSANRRFSGTFDGQDHKITNLTIDTDQSVVGLFSRTQNAVIKNLGLERVDIKSSGDDIGGLIGNDYEGSQISRCYVIGTIQAGAGYGGLLGSTYGNGSDRSQTTVTNCFARVELLLYDDDDDEEVPKDSSGISGWNYRNGIVITNCYSASTGEKRPIAGWSDSSAIDPSNFVDAYYDASLSPDLTENTSLGRTSAQLQTQTTFENWDFTDVWVIDPQQNGGYPYLKNMAPDLNGAPGFYSTGLGGATQSSLANGSIEVQPAIAQVGDTVTITLTPDAGYELDTISAHKEDDAGTVVDPTKIDTNNYTYTMPAYDVTVTVSFKAATYSISYNGLEGAANSNPATYTFGTGIPSLAEPGLPHRLHLHRLVRRGIRRQQG